MRCPICKKEIEDDAKKCTHCGSYTRKRRRLWLGIREVVQFATFIAAIAVLILMYQSNRGLQEQLQLQRQSVQVLFKTFIEEKRPRIEIGHREIEFTDTAWVLYVDLHNNGQADAEDISIYIVLKYEHAPKDTLKQSQSRIRKIAKAGKINHSITLPILKRVNLTSFIEVRYTWKIMNLPYEEKKHYRFYYNKARERYGTRVLLDEQVNELWE